MVKRKQDYDAKIMRTAICLDDCLIEQPYELLKRAITQEPHDADDDDPSSTTPEELLEDKQGEWPEERLPTPGQRVRPGKNNSQVGRQHWQVGDLVTYKGVEMEILHIDDDGLLTLEQQHPDREFEGVNPAKVKKITGKETANHESVMGKSKKGKASAVAGDEDKDEDVDDEVQDDDDLDGFDDEELDEDIDEEPEDEDKDEEDEPVAKRKPGRPRRTN